MYEAAVPGSQLHAGGTQKDSLGSAVFPDLKLNLAEVFDVAYTAEEMKIFEVRESPVGFTVKH